ncbi:unnamed protein product [Prorocentrum cordatum]|uniref:Uncharacterized protein n=1 Tax=Prorocentrum cordatum TaxID=2364126 RepID=A0ABN9UIV6_9DINO|nr:unnamed protein product [Polarella glacialis]
MHLECLLLDSDTACVGCIQFVFEELPGMMFSDAVGYSSMGVMDQLFEGGASPIDVANSPPTGASGMAVRQEASVGHELYIKVLALSSNDVMKEFGKLPKTLGLRGVIVCQRPSPMVVYPFKMIQDRKGAYPTLKIFHRNSMGSQVTYTKDGAKELMKGHSDMLLAATANKVGTGGDEEGQVTFNQGIHSAIPTFQSIKDRRDALNAKSQKRFGKQKSGAIDEVHLDEEGNQHGRSASKGQRATEEEVLNPNMSGTVEYWIWELKFERAFNDCKNGRAENQAKILLPKISGNDRKNLQIHLDLYTMAKCFSPTECKNHDNTELTAKWKELKKAGATFTKFCLKGLSKRYVNQLWKTVDDSDTDISAKRDAMRKMLTATAPWDSDVAAARNIDPCSVKLVQACEDDSEIAEYFMEWVFSDTFQLWISAGNSRAKDVLMFVEEAIALWDTLPEDAVLGEEPALCLLQANTVARLLQALSADSLPQDLNLDIFDSLAAVESEAKRTTGGQTVLRIAGQALMTSAGDYWQKKLDWANQHATSLQEHGGALQQAASDLTAVSTTSVPNKTIGERMLSIAKEIPYWEARMYEGVSDIVKAILLEKATKLRDLLVAGGARGAAAAVADAEAPDESPSAVLAVFKDLFKEMSSIFPADEHVEKSAQDIHSRLLDVDLASKHDLVMQAVREWEPSGDKTRRLRDALHDCRAKELPDDVREPCYKLFEGIVRTAVDNSPQGPMIPVDGSVFDTLEFLAGHAPQPHTDACTKVSAMVNAAWRALVAFKKVQDATSEHAAEAAPPSSEVVDGMVKDLVRALQKYKSTAKPTLLDRFAPGASELLGARIDAAKEFVKQNGSSSVAAIQSNITSKMTTLRQMIKESPHMDEYEKVCMSATALPPILQVAKKGLTDANTGDWLERCAQIEGEVEQLRAKAGEYGITVQTEDIKTIEGAVSEIRAACISIELCSHFGDAELAKIRKYALEPKSMPEPIVNRYRDGLKMK